MALEIKASLAFNETNTALIYTDITGEDNLAQSTKYSTGGSNLNRTKSNTFTELVLTSPENLDTTLLLTTGNVVPKDITTNSLLPASFNYTEGFNVGVYKVKCYVWYKIETTGTDSKADLTNLSLITATFDTDNFTSIRNGFADTSIIKIVQGSNSAIRTTGVVTGTTVALTEALPNTFTVGEENVLVYAGYEVTVYALSDDKFLKCFQPKIAKISIQENDCCSRCKTDDVSALQNMFLGIFAVYAQFESGLYTDANANIKTLLKICEADGCKC